MNKRYLFLLDLEDVTEVGYKYGSNKSQDTQIISDEAVKRGLNTTNTDLWHFDLYYEKADYNAAFSPFYRQPLICVLLGLNIDKSQTGGDLEWHLRETVNNHKMNSNRIMKADISKAVYSYVAKKAPLINDKEVFDITEWPN